MTPGKLRGLVNAMTRGPLIVGLFRSDALDSQVAQFRELMTPGAGRPIYVVATPPDEDGPLSVAITGNGSAGRANAHGIAMLCSLAPALLDLWAACELERDALPPDVRMILAQLEVT